MSSGIKDQRSPDFRIALDSEDRNVLYDLTAEGILVAFTPEHPNGSIEALREGVTALFTDLDETDLISSAPRHWLPSLRNEISKEAVPRPRILLIEEFDQVLRLSPQEQRQFMSGAQQISTCLSVTVIGLVSNAEALRRTKEQLVSISSPNRRELETPREVAKLEAILLPPDRAPQTKKSNLPTMIAAVLFVSTALATGIGIAVFENESDETAQILTEAPIVELSPHQMYVEAEKLCLGSAQDLDKGIRLLELASEKGSQDAMALLGNYYASGHGVEMDRNKAKQLFEIADEEGSRTAPGGLGLMALEKGDLQRAFHLFRAGAERSDPVATFYMAKCFEKGLGTTESLEKAQESFLAAASLDHPEALAWCFASIPDYDPDGAFASTSDGELE